MLCGMFAMFKVLNQLQFEKLEQSTKDFYGHVLQFQS